MNLLHKNELFLIAEKLAYKDILNLSLTCTHMYNTIWNSDEFWVYKIPNLKYSDFTILPKNLAVIYILITKLKKLALKK